MSDSILIQVTPAVLEQMSSRVRHLTVDLSMAAQFDFSRSGPVAAAYDTKAKKWQEHRQEIDTAMDRIASILDAIRETFIDLDTQYADALRGGLGRA